MVVGWCKADLSSSCCNRYTLTFVESCQGVKRGDRILQIGAGSGLKCGVNIWKVGVNTWCNWILIENQGAA